MITLYFWPTPNGYKPLILLEELGLSYKLEPVNIMRGEQFEPEFLKISPNNRIPALTDGDVSIFESGAILIYLAEKAKAFLPENRPENEQESRKGRFDVLQWLMWQMGGLGPMMGQANHFIKYAGEDIPYARQRYLKETERLLGVLNRQLEDKPFITGEYSIPDMACYPWIKGADSLGVEMDNYPQVVDWCARIADRPAVKKAYETGEPVSQNVEMDDEAKKLLFGTK